MILLTATQAPRTEVVGRLMAAGSFISSIQSKFRINGSTVLVVFLQLQLLLHLVIVSCPACPRSGHPPGLGVFVLPAGETPFKLKRLAGHRYGATWGLT